MKKRKIGLWLLLISFFPICINALTKSELQELPLKKVFEFNTATGYSNIQGMIVTDKYFVIAAIKSDTDNTALMVFDKKTYQLANLENNPIMDYSLGHANDFAYSESKNEIYVVTKSTIHVIDADTLKEKTPITLSKNMNGIAIEESTGNYYLRDEQSTYVYDKNFKELSSFSIGNDYAKQGISLKDDFMYFSCYPRQEIDGIQVDNIIYVYKNGEIYNIFKTPNDMGELQATEFDEDTPYLLFNLKNGVGGVFVPTFESVTTSFSIGDFTGTDAVATLSDKNGEIETVEKVNGEYKFKEITYAKEGSYEYTVTKMEKSRITGEENDNNTIKILVDVIYDTPTNSLQMTVNYEKSAFEEEPIIPTEEQNANKTEESKSVTCEVVDGIYYDGNGNQVTESEFTKLCGTVENPQTGLNLPYYIIPIGLGLAVIIGLYRKKNFFKL